MAHSEVTFSFTVRKFSKLADWVWSPSYLVRDECLVQDMPALRCLIKVKRNQTSPDQDKTALDSLSYFIHCRSGTTSSTWSFRANLEFRIKSFKDEDFVQKCSHLFTASEDDWGYLEFKSWAYLINPENGFIIHDRVTFEVKITAESPLEASTVQVIARV